MILKTIHFTYNTIEVKFFQNEGIPTPDINLSRQEWLNISGKSHEGIQGQRLSLVSVVQVEEWITTPRIGH